MQIVTKLDIRLVQYNLDVNRSVKTVNDRKWIYTVDTVCYPIYSVTLVLGVWESTVCPRLAVWRPML